MKVFFSIPSAKKNQDHANVKYAWDSVKEKLLDALHSIEHKSNIGNRIREIEQQRAKQPLSLYAISEGPKFRLLWASFKQLEDEAGTVTIFSLPLPFFFLCGGGGRGGGGV